MSLVTAALFVVSCGKEMPEVEPQGPEERITMLDPWTAIDQSPYLAEPTPGPQVTVSAGFTETKASLDIGASSANMIWKPGDKFFMIGRTDSFEYALFSTSSEGEKVEFMTGHITPSSAVQHNIFGPETIEEIKLGYNGDVFFGLTVPIEQDAVANKPKDDYLFSYAQTSSGDEEFHFKNVMSLVRFKISGSVASTVTSVTITGSSPLAGNCVLIPVSDGKPKLSFARGFTGDVSSMSVTLSGTFAADTWYYVAVVPSVQDVLSLRFSDGTNTCTKTVSKTITFNRGHISSLGTINLGDALAEDPVSYAPIKHLSATAAAAKPVTIAVIPDGFRESEMLQYETLAKSAINALFRVEPYKSYKEYFNVYILKVASNESGARISDGTPAEQSIDCYFESTWGKDDYTTEETKMKANSSKIFTFVQENCPDIINGIHTIAEVPVLMIINDERYGGINYTWSSGQAYCMAPFTYSGGALQWSYSNSGYEAKSDEDSSQGYWDVPDERWAEVGSSTGNWINTMVHEFGGHCFGRLADEYWTQILSPVSFISEHRYDSQYPNGVPFGLNVSATYANPGYDDPGLGSQYIKEGWQHLLDRKSELVASNPLYGRIGVYQGGGTSLLNRWRSERVSCMIDNRFFFSTFQRELIVRRIMTLAGEPFVWEDFLAKDVPVDPVRDVVSSPVAGTDELVIPRPVPPLPPPVLMGPYQK